ncbi:hypothetical protein SBA6_410019 [Candidatus Sulfopaludibacter sp. SbA6]|nr:hypothetical protein SBA6_410019 [Candidatus Sulfopaludibacter sp. SbA6]
MLFHPSAERRTVEMRHANITDHEAEPTVEILNQREGSQAVIGLNHPESLSQQNSFNERANLRLVVHQKNGQVEHRGRFFSTNWGQDHCDTDG